MPQNSQTRSKGLLGAVALMVGMTLFVGLIGVTMGALYHAISTLNLLAIIWYLLLGNVVLLVIAWLFMAAVDIRLRLMSPMGPKLS